MMMMNLVNSKDNMKDLKHDDSRNQEEDEVADQGLDEENPGLTDVEAKNDIIDVEQAKK